MARRLFNIAAVVLLLLPSIVFADIANTFVWFDATGLNPQSGIVTQGVEGADLGLSCDTSAGPAVCQWRVNMRVHNLVQLASMGMDLLGDTNTLSISDATHGDFPGDGYTGQGHNYQTPNSGGVLAILKEVSVPIDSNSQYVTSQGAPGFYNPVSFTLTATKSAGDYSIDLIDARVNSLVWAAVTQFGPAPQVILAFGDAPLVPGSPLGGIAPGVIEIQSIPEPTTVLFLLFGAAVVLRDRRAVRSN